MRSKDAFSRAYCRLSSLGYLVYVEKVRSQFLSLRYLRTYLRTPGTPFPPSPSAASSEETKARRLASSAEILMVSFVTWTLVPIARRDLLRVSAVGP
jgi:hypothetical protein